jgi:hypothetical protein
MELEQGIEQLYEAGGLLRRRSWESDIGISLEDVIADDWEITECSEEDE